MPFTLAHPAAALPFYTRWRDGFVAMVIGSMAPDIPYFLPSRIGDSMPSAHGAVAAITIASPMALLMLLMMVALRRVVVAPLWGGLYIVVERALERLRQSRAGWLQAVPAVVIGAEIHIFWDSFTHKSGWVALHAPLLTSSVSPLASYPLDLSRVLQYLSSIVGMAIVGYWARQRLKRARAVDPPPGFKPAALLLLSVFAAVAAWRAVCSGHTQPMRPHGWEYLASTAFVGTFVMLFVGWGTCLKISQTLLRSFEG